MRRRRLIFAFPVCVSLAFTACRQEAVDRQPANGHASHEAKFVTVNGVRLQYLDWGGVGDGLVFLHGLGDSPHAYDEIASAFANRFRVVAYARRGHGRSDVRGPYDNNTLVEDLRQLLDSLSIQRAALVGWSLGGNEITEFAARYPERVLGLVYLDCFDTADPAMARANENFPFSFFPNAADLADLPAFRAWQKRTWWADTPWSPAMEAHADDLVEQAPGGSLRFVTSDSVTGQLFSGAYAYHARWRDVRAPVLAFFAQPYREAFLPPDASEAQKERVDRWLREYQMPFFEARIPEFRASLPHARLVILERTNHAALPFQRRDTILSEMHTFLERELRSR